MSAPNATSRSEVSYHLASDIKNVFLSDSVTSNLISFRREWFSSFTPLVYVYVELIHNGICDVKGIETINAKRLIDDVWCSVNLENVLYVSSFKQNLFSVDVCTTKKLDVKFMYNAVEVLREDQVF